MVPDVVGRVYRVRVGEPGVDLDCPSGFLVAVGKDFFNAGRLAGQPVGDKDVMGFRVYDLRLAHLVVVVEVEGKDCIVYERHGANIGNCRLNCNRIRKTALDLCRSR